MGSGVSVANEEVVVKDIEEQIRKLEQYPKTSDIKDLDVARALISRLRGYLKHLFQNFKKSHIDTILNSFNTKGADVPLSTWLDFAESTKAALGPAAMTVQLCKAAVIEAENNVDVNRAYWKAPALAPIYVAKAETLLKHKRESLQRAESKLEETQKRLVSVRHLVGEQVGHKLVNDVCKYDSALETLLQSDPEQYAALTRVTRCVRNRGPLENKQHVQVEVDGKFVRARVETVRGADINTAEVDVSLWKEKINQVAIKYEEGYDTSSKVVRTFSRAEVYGGGKKTTQPPISDTTVTQAAKVSSNAKVAACLIRNPQRPEYLMALYMEAKASRERMAVLAKEVEEFVNTTPSLRSSSLASNTPAEPVHALVPGLKGIERATVKTAEKYGGWFDRLTDLARMTFVCTTPGVAVAVLNFLRDHKGWTIVRVKDRLNPAYDASSTGGYRDVLLNVRDGQSGHIVEIQVTFQAFYDIKSKGGGHKVYKLARLLELNEKETTDFDGRLTEDVLERIRVGLIRNVRCDGVDITSATLDTLFSERGLFAPMCAVTNLCMESIKNLEGWDLTRVLPVSMFGQIGPRLRYLGLSGCHVKGEIPANIGDLKLLQTLDLSHTHEVSGPIPDSIGNLKQLQRLQLQGTNISGPIPDSIGNLKQLQRLWLGSTKLSGPIPTSIGNLKQLQALSMDDTEVSGPIPDSIGNLKQLKWLDLSGTKVSGAIPASIGNLKQLQKLYLQCTEVSGVIPATIGDLKQLKYLDLRDTKVSGHPDYSEYPSMCFYNRRQVSEFLAAIKK